MAINTTDTTDDVVWSGAYKIPWDDPAFSRRMLALHLAQDHDMASRRVDWIQRQVEWIHGQLLYGRSARILDLGCGPGFYSHWLAMLGHRCTGIDFGPASIEYAREKNPDPSRCDFRLGDIRQAEFGGPYDLAMILFGEMNVFSPGEILAILRRAHASLAQGEGRLLLEVQTPEAVERTGRSDLSEQQSECGLFSEKPHCCRTESVWLPEERVAVQTFTITELDGGETRRYRNTTKAWSPQELIALLESAGFRRTSQHPDWPCNTESLTLWSARE